MKRISKLKLSTGLQLAATLISGIYAINAMGRYTLWISVIMFVVISGSIGRFLYVTRLITREPPIGDEARDSVTPPWLLPEI
jgi:hypothetical protein